MEFLIILGLILFNGILSMSEIALVSARKSKLEYASRKGDAAAKRALSLTARPDNFLSTVQIGITLIGILTGVFSGETMTSDLSAWFDGFPSLAPFSGTLSVTIVVLCITYFTLVLGELVPKRIAMSHPEKIAGAMSAFMLFLSKVATPFVWLLSASTRWVIKILGIPDQAEDKVTEEEIMAIIQEGTSVGEIEEVEQDIVERVFDLSDRGAVSLMTNRNDLVWIDINRPLEEIRSEIKSDLHQVYPVSRGQLDEIVGVVYLKDMFDAIHLPDATLDQWVRPAQFVPETMNAYNILELFKQTKIHYALVTDEYGSILGIITMFDILDALVGNITEDHPDDDQIVVREDGSFLVDGQYSFYDFLAYFDIEDRFPEHDYNTLSGLILDLLRHIPQIGEKVTWAEFNFEIVDMDGVRIDKILVTHQSVNPGEGENEENSALVL